MYMDEAMTIQTDVYACSVELGEFSMLCECISQSRRARSGTWAEKQYDHWYDDPFVNSTVLHQEIAGGPSPRVPENHLPVIFEGSVAIRATYTV